MKLFVRIVCLVLVAILGCVILFNLACYVKGAITGEQCPLVFGFGSAVVISGSMEDTISPLDLVIVQRKKAYFVDDIVIYQGDRYCVTHRIIDMQRDEGGQVWVTTKGDFNSAPDDPIPYEHIIGKVIFWIPWVGHIRQFLRQPAGFLLLTFVAGACLYVPEWLKKRKKTGEE